MFFSFPIAATAENWLHEGLSEMVTAVHGSLDAGAQPLAWPGIIPAAHRARLRSRTGLRDRLATYTTAAQALTPAQRTRVLTCLTQQNAIADLVSAASDCDSLTDLPNSIREPARDLFVFAFGLLTDLGVRDRHYTAIYNASQYHVCPFCFSEFFDAPGAPREDYDHYLASSRYPFAAANLLNLTPMGMKCNERYKLADDILRDDNGNRRRSFAPYANRKIRVSLTNSIPFGQPDGQTPEWQIEFVPDSPECVTWDSVFLIRTRLARDVLNPSFRNWLGAFARWFVIRQGVNDLSDGQIIASLGEYTEDVEIMGLTACDCFRVPLFQMIEQHCANGNARLLQLMRDLVTHAVPQPPVAV